MNSLTIGCLKKYFMLGGKSDVEVSDVLQVLDCKKTISKIHGEIYIASLSDSEHQFPRFFLKRESGGPISVGDLINIKIVNKATANSKIFLKILKHEVVGHVEGAIGNPKQIETEIIGDDNIEKKTKEQISGNPYISNQEPTLKIKTVGGTYIRENALTNSASKNGSSHIADPIDLTTEEETKVIKKVEPTKTIHMSLSTISTFTKDLQILVKCIKRSENKPFKNKAGLEGSVFNFVITDSEGSEMQVTCFNKIASKFSLIVHEGGIYEILGGYIKVKDHKYSQTKSDYQILLNDETVINPIVDNHNIGQDVSRLTKLSELGCIKVYSFIDFVAIVYLVHEKTSVKSKYGEMNIKKLVIIDDSGYKVDLTLWKQLAELPIKKNDIIYVKKGKVGEYAGKNISASDDSQVLINPNLEGLKSEITVLKNFLSFTDGVHDINESEDFKTHISNAKTLDKQTTDGIKKEDIKLSSLLEAYNNEDRVHRVKVFVTQFNNGEKNIYSGCPKCKKKLIDTSEGSKCNSCNEMVHKPYYYFTVSVRMKDHSSDQWVDHFGNIAEKLLNITGEEYKNALMESNDALLVRVCENVEFRSFIITVRSRTTSYNNIVKKKLNCLGIEKLELKSDAERMLNGLTNFLHPNSESPFQQK